MKLRFDTDSSLPNGEHIVTAFDHQDKDAGMITFGPDHMKESRGHIVNLWVPPSHRGKGGAASTLLRYAEDELCNLGFVDASVLVKTPNTHARKFYERMGWQEADIQIHHAHVEYRKPLTRECVNVVGN